MVDTTRLDIDSIQHAPDDTLDSVDPTFDSVMAQNLPVMEAAPNFSLNDDLMDIRHKMPFISVMPMPLLSTIVEPTINVAADISIPDNAVLAQFTSIAPFYMSRMGNANGLNSKTSQTQGNSGDSADMYMQTIDPNWYYVGNMRSISVYSKTAANVIAAKFIMRDQI